MRLSPAAASAAADAVCGQLSAGYLCLYAGATLLAELRFGSPAFRDAADGQAIVRTLTKGFATNTGTATRFQAFTARRALVLDGTVGPTNADLILNNPFIQRDAEVNVGNLTYIQPRS